MQITDCDVDRDAPALQRILNEAIIHSTALYDYEPRALATVTAWAHSKGADGFALRGAFDEQKNLMGFATFGAFRPQPAYKYTVEHSVYVDSSCRGQGIGFALLQDLLHQAQVRDYHVVIGCIDAANGASIALHERLGFVHCGTIKEAGFKFGRWLDAAFYQRRLPTPSAPIDG
jgi:L-amino acid N-acyltransferase YncA